MTRRCAASIFGDEPRGRRSEALDVLLTQALCPSELSSGVAMEQRGTAGGAVCLQRGLCKGCEQDERILEQVVVNAHWYL